MVSFEWSSPVRRVRGRMLSPIPLEVYLEIYTYLEPSQELSRAESNVILSKLAKVCRFFGAHSLSRLYRTLDLSGEDAGSSGHSAFCGLLVKSTAYKNAGKPLTSNMEMALQLASFVKECTFRDWLPSDRLIPMADAFLLRNARAVRLTKNVNKIYISATPLTNPLVQTVYNLKATLSTLSIRNCPLEIELTQHQQNHLSNLKLASLEFLSPSSSPFDIPPETLRLKDLREFITDSGRLSDHFLRRPHPFLRRLELQDVQDLPLLFARLDKCPTITELTINNVMRPLGGGPPKIPALAATALPDLETLSIPTILLDSCMRRTVRKLSILGAQREYNGPGAAGLDGVGFLFPTLALLTAEKVTALVKKDHLTELHIPQHLYFDIPLHKQLPQLEKLVLSWCHPNFPEIEPAPVVPVLFPWQRSPSPTPHINVGFRLLLVR
ncbi:hypothetical protein C8F01DRAFT_1089152 [Mycena amicta]|nr:hypothetical protein C8F01DRAFT_1089152 [Mycena amicta]